MSNVVAVEARDPDTSDTAWRHVGTLAPTDPCGSLSHEVGESREVLMFGWRDGVPGVWRSTFGMDHATADYRIIDSAGFEMLAALWVQPLEITVHRGGKDLAMRFSVRSV